MLRIPVLAASIALGLALKLTGCSSVNYGTVAALQQLSPLTANPADIALSVDLPPGFAVLPDQTALTLSVTRSDTGESAVVSVPLAIGQGADGAVTLMIPSDHWSALQGVQAQARQWKAAAPKATQGSLALQAGLCSLGGDVPNRARASVRIRLDSGGPFRPLITDGPLRAILGAGDVQPCPSTR